MRLPAGRWAVETLAIGGELQPTLEGPMLTLEVTPEGEVSGNAGVNEFEGRLGSDGLFGHLVTTSRTGSHDLIAQERIYLKHLTTADGFELDPDNDGINLVARGLIVVALRCFGAGQTG